DDNKDFPFIPADFGGPIPLGQVNEYPFVPAGAVDPGNALGCDSFDPGAFAGKAAVIQRGDCAFVDKFFNAQEAGALFVIIFNNDGDDLVTMICDINCDAITVSGVFIGETDGQKLLDWYNV